MQLFDETPLKQFSSSERRPGVITKRRWEQLSENEQAFVARHVNQKLSVVTEQDIRQYLLHLIDEKNLSRATLNQTLSALKFCYQYVLHEPRIIGSIPRPRPERKLPAVLSRGEVLSLFAALSNLKHRALLILAYSAGSRVSEVVQLRVEDIDVNRSMIRVRQAKGNKDRYTVLSEVALVALRTYWQTENDPKWAFPGARRDRHLNTRSVQKVFTWAKKKTGLNNSTFAVVRTSP